MAPVVAAGAPNEKVGACFVSAAGTGGLDAGVVDAAPAAPKKLGTFGVSSVVGVDGVEGLPNPPKPVNPVVVCSLGWAGAGVPNEKLGAAFFCAGSLSSFF